MDRDLQRTGNSIVLLSAGAGVFTVDRELARITEQRMMDNGIGMDMLSLAVPPLHFAPIFILRRRNMKCLKRRFKLPLWINLSFVDPSRANNPRAWIAAAAPRLARDVWRMGRLELSAPSTPRHHNDDDVGITRYQISTARGRIPGVSRCDGYQRPMPFAKNHMPDALAYLVELFDSKARRGSSSLQQNVDQTFAEDDGHGALEVSKTTECGIANLLVGGLEVENALINRSSSLHTAVGGYDVHEYSALKGCCTSEYSALNGSLLLSAGNIACQPSIHIGSLSSRKAKEYEANLPYVYSSLNSPSGLRSGATPTYKANFATTTAKEAGSCPHRFFIVQGNDDAKRSSPQADATKSSEPVSFTREKRDSLGSRSPSRHRQSFEELFDNHDENVFATGSPVMHEPLQRRATFTTGGTPQTATPPSNDMSRSHRRPNSNTSRDHAFSLGRLRDHVADAQQSRRLHSAHHFAAAPGFSEQHFQPDRHLHNLVAENALKNTEPIGELQPHTPFGRGVYNPVKREDEAENFNPFKLEDVEEIMRQKNHNRCRWSHVFPQGEEEFRSTHGSAGPNWKSLTTPAILPLETDYLLGGSVVNGLKDNSFSFTDNLYSKIVYEGGKGRRLFEEMIAQRIAGDYQIVKEGADKQGQGNKRAKNDKPSLDGQSSSIVHLASSNGDAWHSRRLVPQQQHAVAAGSAITRNNLAGSANSCTVSMGHRIQTLIYDGSSVHVRISRSKKNNNDADSQYKYTYSLWLSDCDGAMSKSDIRGTHIAVYVAKTQTFLKYPSPETNWNLLDEVICTPSFGYNAGALDLVKFRRVRFVIIPGSDGTEYFNCFDKFENFLNAKRASSSRHGLAVYRVRSPEGGTDLPSSNLAKQHLEIALEHSLGCEQWLTLECDPMVHASRCYRFAVHWLLCAGWLVEEFLILLCRRAKQIGLNLVQVPEYSLRFDIHPFVASAIVMRSIQLQESTERRLLQHMGYVLDSMSTVKVEPCARSRAKDCTAVSGRCDGHLGNSGNRSCESPVKGNIAEQPANLIASSSSSFIERQYVSRSGSAFIRVHADGCFTWVKNRLRNPYSSFKIKPHEEYDERILQRIRDQAAKLSLIQKILNRAYMGAQKSAGAHGSILYETVDQILFNIANIMEIVADLSAVPNL